MCISNKSFVECDWIPVSQNVNWMLSQGNGIKTIYLKFRDSKGKIIKKTGTTQYTANIPPQTSDDYFTRETSQPLTFQLQATDNDNDSLKYSLINICQLGTMTLNSTSGMVVYTPLVPGIDSFQFIAHDGYDMSNTGTIMLYLNFDDQPPVITNLEDELYPLKEKKWIWNATDKSPPVSFCFVVDQIPEHDSLDGNFSSEYTQTHLSQKTGIFYLHVQAKDVKGNISPVKTVKTILDNTPPDQFFIDNCIQDDCSILTNQNPLIIHGSKEIDTQVFSNNQKIISQTDKAFKSTAWQYSINLYEGQNIFSFKARDLAGNESNSISAVITLDSIPPKATYDLISNQLNTAVTITVSGHDISHYKYTLDNLPESSEIPIDQNLQIPRLKTGHHQITLIARDAAGNWEIEEEIIQWLTTNKPVKIEDISISPLIFGDEFWVMKETPIHFPINISGGLPPFTYEIFSETCPDSLYLSPTQMPSEDKIFVMGNFSESKDCLFDISVTCTDNTKSSLKDIKVHVMKPLTATDTKRDNFAIQILKHY
ncbi:hypothetical protein MHK_002911, partial [Candidatus Magnetomorum sp. HK-1]